MAELISKQPSPMRIPSRDQAETEELVAVLLGPEVDRRKPSAAAKAAGLLTGAIVLFATVATAALLAGNRPANMGVPRTERPIELSGASALRPDMLAAQLPEDSAQPAAPSQVPAPLLVKEAPQPIQPPHTEVATPLVTTGPQPQIDVVRKFYELLTTSPAAAAKLLSPDLVGADPHEFAQAWGMVKTINVDSASLRPDGSVLAVVSMQELDGSWLRLEQLFWLTDTSTPRIIGTEVLSAQRS